MLDVSEVTEAAVAALEAAGIPTITTGLATNVRTPGSAVVAPPSAQWPDAAVTLDGTPVDPLWTVPVYVLAGSGDRAHLADVYQATGAVIRALASAGFLPDSLEPSTYVDAPAYLVTVTL